MHAEWGRSDAAAADRLNAARAAGGRVIAVGTTSLRLLESAAGEDGLIRPFEGDTAIFITPGYRFRTVDGLLTNFHLPRSTLFMLVSAMMGLDRIDRTSVVEGTSVSVRVDLGGRSIIKNKRDTNIQPQI